MTQRLLKIVLITAILSFSSRSNGAGLATGAATAGTKSPAQVTFSLTGVNYRFILPEGFSRVSGKDSEIATTIASLDSANMTHFTIIPHEEAGRDAGFTRWGMLKTPHGSLGKRIPTRQQWVKDAKNKIKRRDFVESSDDAIKLIGKNYKDVFGDDVKIGMHMEMVDADEYAGYATGTITTEIAGRKELIAGAGAMTVVRGNVFFYYKYGPYSDLSDLVGLLKQVKSEIRRFVTDNPD